MPYDTDDTDTELVVQQKGAVLQVILNRPGALNALSLEMIRLLTACLEKCRTDDKIRAVFIQGAGERAFCAGGDIKSAYKTGMAYRKGEADVSVATLFFAEEYRLNRLLFHFEKPLFAFMNGLTMGGGFGIAGPCSYRIAGESTVFAMPETGIGFFPDVGSVYFLNRAPGEAGACLALTGGSIGPEDTLYCGFATHYVPAGSQYECREALFEVINRGGKENFDSNISDVLAKFHMKPTVQGDLEKRRSVIDSCFAGNRVQPVINRLHESGDAWALEQAETIGKRSPVSLKVSLTHLRMGKTMNFDEITAQDFVLVQHFMSGHDFYEGVRAAVVDKDRRPQWEPAALADVTEEMVQDYFRPARLVLDEMAA